VTGGLSVIRHATVSSDLTGGLTGSNSCDQGDLGLEAGEVTGGLVVGGI
jgi:hypothetical protein